MNPKLIFITLISISCFQELFAQFPNKKLGNQTNVDTSGDVVVLTPEQAKHYERNHKINNADNIIKAGVLYWGTGVYPIYYERKLTSFLGLQGGLGFTVRDYVADIVNFIIDNDYANYTYRKAVPGVYAGFMPKFYVVDRAPEGFYLGPGLEYKLYNYHVELVNSSGNYIPGTWMREHRTALDFTLTLGGQWLVGKHFVIDYSSMLGFRRFWETRQNIYQDIAGNSINGVYSYNGYRPEIMVNLQLGGFF